METATVLNYIMVMSFVVYFIISLIFKTMNTRNIEEALHSRSGLLLLDLRHIIGIIIFGLLFYLIAPEFRYLISPFQQPGGPVLTLGVFVLALSAILAYRSAIKKIKEKDDRAAISQNLTWVYFPIRIVFLFSYEFFFRGLVFFSLLQHFDLYISILVTTILYVVIHSFDSKAEILGAIPFGILLCILTYFTNSIWMAFIIHTTLSGVYEFIIYKNLTIKSKKR
jgi:membrane protease YdiL (CAAX protease family)